MRSLRSLEAEQHEYHIMSQPIPLTSHFHNLCSHYSHDKWHHSLCICINCVYGMCTNCTIRWRWLGGCSYCYWIHSYIITQEDITCRHITIMPWWSELFLTAQQNQHRQMNYAQSPVPGQLEKQWPQVSHPVCTWPGPEPGDGQEECRLPEMVAQAAHHHHHTGWSASGQHGARQLDAVLKLLCVSRNINPSL